MQLCLSWSFCFSDQFGAGLLVLNCGHAFAFSILLFFSVDLLTSERQVATIRVLWLFGCDRGVCRLVPAPDLLLPYCELRNQSRCTALHFPLCCVKKILYTYIQSIHNIIIIKHIFISYFIFLYIRSNSGAGSGLARHALPVDHLSSSRIHQLVVELDANGNGDVIPQSRNCKFL